MFKKAIIVIIGITTGLLTGYFLVKQTKIIDSGKGKSNSNLFETFTQPKKKVIGFLPFWLIDRAQEDYSKYITQLSYFNLTISEDGSIQKYTNPGEADPGWHALFTGKVDNYLSNAKSKGIELSLTIFSGDDEKIDKFLENPDESAQNLISDISPILKDYGFNDLNLDIEKVKDATPRQREKYVKFVSKVREKLNPEITITVDAPGIAFVRDKNLVDPEKIIETIDYIVLMGYDFHNVGSYVTGPVSPQTGAGIVSEFDIVSAVQAALTKVPAEKFILAIPLYGYSWETINQIPRSAIVPSSGYSISSKSVEKFLGECATCSAEFEKTDMENYIIYKDTETGTYHQIFYPDEKSTQIKVNFAKSQKIAGMALWALGYEDSTILQPLSGYFR